MFGLVARSYRYHLARADFSVDRRALLLSAIARANHLLIAGLARHAPKEG